MIGGNACGKEQLRPWLEGILNKCKRQDVYWIDQKEGIFCIRWPKFSPSCPEKCSIYKEWAIHRGSFREGIDKVDYSKWKTRLRTALNKSPDFEYMEKKSKRQDEPSRVYKILSRKKSLKSSLDQVAQRPLSPMNAFIPTVVENFSSLNNSDDDVKHLKHLRISKNKIITNETNTDYVENMLTSPDFMTIDKYENEQMIISPNYNSEDNNLMNTIEDNTALIRINLINTDKSLSFCFLDTKICHLHTEKELKYSQLNLESLYFDLLKDPIFENLLEPVSSIYLTHNYPWDRIDYLDQWHKCWNILNEGLIIFGKNDGIFVYSLTEVQLTCISQENLIPIIKNSSKSLKVFDMNKFNEKLSTWDGTSLNEPCSSADIYFDQVDGICLKATHILAEQKIKEKLDNAAQNDFEEILNKTCFGDIDVDIDKINDLDEYWKILENSFLLKNDNPLI